MSWGLDALQQLPKWDGSQFSPIDVPRQLLAALGNPQNIIPAVHVAGTNGKGSVCAELAACLHASGSSVGQFVSPHLSSVTERCMINGSPIAEADFSVTVDTVIQTAEQLQLNPSYFVVTMIASFLQFVEKKLDWMVVEVGLGGTLDATNLIERPQLSVITRIDLDHSHLLGTTIEEIASNKAGIIKPEVPVVIGNNSPSAREVCVQQARLQRAPYYLYGEEFEFDAATRELSWEKGSFTFGQESQDLVPYQLENRCTAVRAAVLLGLSDSIIRTGLAAVRWPGRMELLMSPAGEVPVLLEGLHNPSGAEAFSRALPEFLQRFPTIRRLRLIVAARSTKNWREVIAIISNGLAKTDLQTDWFCTGGGIDFAVDPVELATACPGAAIEADPQMALARSLQDATSDTMVLILGSLHLIGLLRPQLSDQPFRTIVST